MSEKKGLSYDAYGGIPGDKYEPFVPNDKKMAEFTWSALFFGIIFALIFAATNTYLGLKVGMTVSASIPAAVLSTVILRGVLRRQNILEANLMQATGSAGESIASGIMFTLPALIVWGFSDEFTVMKISLIAVLGSILGVLMVVPLRRSLVSDEHGTLPYPEGLATAEILVAGQGEASSAKGLILGGTIGALFKVCSGALKLFPEDIEWKIPFFKNGVFGFNVVASLMGVGFIVGPQVGCYMMAGGLLSWLVLIPTISYFGAGNVDSIFPSVIPISKMSAGAIWSNYIRYIGAGAVATGGFISLARSLSMIVSSFKAALSGMKGGQSAVTKRTETDINIIVVFVGVFGVFVSSLLFSEIYIGLVGSICVIVFGFFFAAVSARVAGIVGVSNLPVSGMTIAALLISTLLLKMSGLIGNAGMIAAITTGAIICVATSMAGSLGQNLKTAYIIGATPKWVEIGMIIGGIASATVVAGVILMFHQAYGIGSSQIAAPQATLMSMVIKGVMTGALPWNLVLSGGIIGIILVLLNVPILPVAIGLYLPIYLSAAVLSGGIIRHLIERAFDGAILKSKVERGILFASGLIAGDSLMGILIAFLAYKGLGDAMAIFSGFSLAENSWWGLAFFILLGGIVYQYVARAKAE